jgi:glycosyltransferase involved in cell wall biosynthesis
VIELLFWAFAAFVVYAYFGYPILMLAIARMFPRPAQRSAILPPVSFIITVHNEEARIDAKIQNTLELDYPRDRFQIIVASDHSVDGTHAIVQAYADRGVRLVVSAQRGGKESAQKLAIQHSSGEILVFSDVATRLDPWGIREIVSSFADPTVGCVSSVDRIVDAGGRVTGEGAYVRYEMFLRSVESTGGTLVGLSGSFFAARREVCHPWSTDLPSDFTTLLNTLGRGLRGVADPAAVGYYHNIADERREYGRKVRTVVRGIAGLSRHLYLLNPFRYGLAAWQLFSHKLCRWLVPFALIGLFVTNLLLASASFGYFALAGLQVAVYGIAAAGFPRHAQLSGVPRLITFLVLVNVSILNAWYDVFRGRRVVVWEPSKR